MEWQLQSHEARSSSNSSLILKSGYRWLPTTGSYAVSGAGRSGDAATYRSSHSLQVCGMQLESNAWNQMGVSHSSGSEEVGLGSSVQV
jgi:hypothetical protein